MSEMVERVACAVGDAIEGREIDPFLYPEAFDHYEKIARAAIAAMREPTETMWDHGASNMQWHSATRVWQAMIDEALKSNPTP